MLRARSASAPPPPRVPPAWQVSVSLEHQVALVRHHLALAGRLQRPISMHCVRATGAMQVRRRTAAVLIN